jgi:hypothetical protein
MTSRGVHFALTARQERQLLGAVGDDDAVMDLIEEIEEDWDDQYVLETDKAWAEIDRCLGEEPPLGLAVLGGRQVYDGDDYLAHYVSADEVERVAEALAPLDEAWLSERCEEEFDYIWENFADLKAFFELAAKQRRSVLFTADG